MERCANKDIVQDPRFVENCTQPQAWNLFGISYVAVARAEPQLQFFGVSGPSDTILVFCVTKPQENDIYRCKCESSCAISSEGYEKASWVPAAFHPISIYFSTSATENISNASNPGHE
jgi:hypothetical protein